MSMHYLGRSIDIHTGGEDNVFPHHECENAQSEAATGRPFVRHWMHSGTVQFEGHKMAKSLGNLAFVSELRKKWNPMAIRLAILSSHYRSSWEWSPVLLDVAQERLSLWSSCAVGDDALEEVRRALDDDLDTVSAIEAIDQAAQHGARITDAAGLLGLKW